MEARAVIKQQAKICLKGKWIQAIVIVAIMSVLTTIVGLVQTFVLNGIIQNFDMYNYLSTIMLYGIKAINPQIMMTIAICSLIRVFITILMMTLALSQIGFFLGLADSAETDYKTFLKTKRFFESFKISLLVTVKIFLWMLLFIVPGIIKAFSYFLAPYLKYRNPNRTCNECIQESCKIMNGYKGTLFVLNLSFIGWVFLAGMATGVISFIPVIGTVVGQIVSFVLGAVISAYMTMSFAIFYKELTTPYLTTKRTEFVLGDYTNADGEKNTNQTADPFKSSQENKDAFGGTYDKKLDNNDGFNHMENTSNNSKNDDFLK